ncbi:hypothetical protein CRUP_029665 [Coryphaenoides rupestris]|nr:hypothetical protein CRUP_029665 [Coryphaenoides rupestris]
MASVTVRSAEDDRKERSCACQRHWITLSPCSPTTVTGSCLWAPGEKRTERTSLACGRYVCTMRPPRMSYSMQALSSCPVARRRPLGSTATEATGLPPWKEVPTTRTQLGTRRSQKRTVLSWEPEAIIQPPHVYRDRM